MHPAAIRYNQRPQHAFVLKHLQQFGSCIINMQWVMPCTCITTHTHICSHAIIYTCRLRCVSAGVGTGGTSVQWTPSILNPDLGLVSVFTCKWSTTICGPSRLLCPSSRLGPGKRAARQMGGPHQMGSHGQRAKLQEKGEGRGCLVWQPLKQQGLPHSMDVVHGLVSFSDWREQGERGKELIMGLRTTGAKLEKTKNKEKSADQCD